MQSSQSLQSPDVERQEQLASVDQVGKYPEEQTGSHCNREVQVPAPPTANHNQEEAPEEDRFSSSRMYLSG